MSSGQALPPAFSDSSTPGQRRQGTGVVEGMRADLEALGKHSSAGLPQAVRAMTPVL